MADRFVPSSAPWGYRPRLVRLRWEHPAETTIRVADHSSILRTGYFGSQLQAEVAMRGTIGGTQVPVWQKMRARYHGTNSHRDLQPLPRRVRHSVQPPVTLRSRFAAVTSNPDFIAIAIFCAIGLLATVNLILRIPELGML
jgi:hypothetical protein